MTNCVSQVAHGISIFMGSYKHLFPQGSKKNVTRMLTFKPVCGHPVINSNIVYHIVKHDYIYISQLTQ
jgi:hypothetical protein